MLLFAHDKLLAHMKINLKNGFTLIELTMVLMIIGLLLAGLIPTLSAQVEAQRINETRKQLEEIKEALIGFAISKGRLPCPADSTTPTGMANASGVYSGTEYKDPLGFCAKLTGSGNTRAWGVVPWATLGVGETDAWGRRFSYRVTNSFADITDGAAANGASAPPCATSLPASGVSFQLCSGGNFNVLTKTSGNEIAKYIPILIISHGKNGLGAYMPNGAQIPPASSGDELSNSDILYMDYVSHDPTPSFDDLVVWLSPNILFNRMVTAGKLPGNP